MSLRDTSERRIGSHCELFVPFAQGGMATIYLGRWSGGAGFRKVVAVKTLHPHLAKDSRLRDMLRDEARVLARIRHPNVLQTIDVIEDDDEVFMVANYVHGATLSQLARRAEQRIPIGVAVRVVSDALHGLHAAHEARDEEGRHLRLVHRDVSPQNILVGTDGYAQLIDFGVAHARGRIAHTRTGEIKGKMSYLAPEQLGDGEIDRRADVYGASVVLWQALTGRKLFDRPDYAQLFAAILREPIDPPSLHAEGISRELDAIVMRGLARAPDDRFETAEDMAAALDDLRVEASRRSIATWVSHVARDRLDAMAETLRSVELAPPLPFGGSGRQVSLIDPDDLEISETMRPQPSRTQLTSLADATPTRPSDNGALSWVAGVGVFALAGAIWFAALSQRTQPPAPAAAPPVVVTQAPAPPPVPSATITPSASASTTATAAPKPPPRPVRRRVRREWIPDGI